MSRKRANSDTFSQFADVSHGSHVHFHETAGEHEAKIAVKPTPDGGFEVHFGLLQIRYRYNIKFTIEHRLGDTITMDTLSNPHLQANSCKPKGRGHEIDVTFFAHKEKLVKEKMILKNAKGATVNLSLISRVLGRGKGKPALRKNIRCIGKELLEDEEDHSQLDDLDDSEAGNSRVLIA